MPDIGWQVGIDIGGTFTDLVALKPATRRARSIKVPTQRNDPVASIKAALAAAGLAANEVDDLIHGTTLVTNAIVEDRVDPVALVATRGFEDVLDIGRGGRQHLYRLDLPPRRLRRCRRSGASAWPNASIMPARPCWRPMPARSPSAVARVKASGVESVAVSLLPRLCQSGARARASAQALKAAMPFVSLSHEVNPETREFERTAHDGAQRLGHAHRRPLSRPPAARGAGRAPARHAFGRRHGLARGRRAPAARHGAVRPGRRRLRRRPCRRHARARQGLELRHGRHDDRRLPDRAAARRKSPPIPSSPAGRCASPWSPSNRSAPAAARW